MAADLANWDTPLQLRVRRKDGFQAWIELKMLAVLDKSGRISGVEGDRQGYIERKGFRTDARGRISHPVGRATA